MPIDSVAASHGHPSRVYDGEINMWSSGWNSNGPCVLRLCPRDVSIRALVEIVETDLC